MMLPDDALLRGKHSRGEGGGKQDEEGPRSRGRLGMRSREKTAPVEMAAMGMVSPEIPQKARRSPLPEDPGRTGDSACRGCEPWRHRVRADGARELHGSGAAR